MDSESSTSLAAGSLESRANAIISEADQLIASMEELSEQASLQTVRDQLKELRAKLFAVVVEKHHGNKDDAALSDDYDDAFKRITAAAETPKPQRSRPFPGTRKFVSGADGGGFMGK